MPERKNRNPENDAFPDDFLQWLVGPKGQLSEQALFAVMDSLESCLVDPKERVIVWNDGKRLSIRETALPIHKRSKLPLPRIESHVVGWLAGDALRATGSQRTANAAVRRPD